MPSQTEFFNTTIKPRQEKLRDDLVMQDQGNSIWTKTPDAKTLSPGCMACKTGTWMCIYVGYKCNATCEYCPQGSNEEKNARRDDEESTRYMSINLLKGLILKQAGKVKGISYSGGEPLLYLPKIIDIATYVSIHNPTAYQWIYTNGLLLNEENLRVLKDLNIQEVRVHLGATNFSEEVMEHMKLAVKYIPSVNVETPAVPSAKEHLLGKGKIHRLEEIGVKQINLGELMVRCAFNDAYIGNAEVYDYCSDLLNVTSPTYSRQITYDIMEYAIHHKINIIINDCSNGSKYWQQYISMKNELRMQC